MLTKVQFQSQLDPDAFLWPASHEYPQGRRTLTLRLAPPRDQACPGVSPPAVTPPYLGPE